MEAMAEGYDEIRPWGGHRRWKCQHCAYDALDESVIAAHVAEFHPHFRCTICGFESREGNQIRSHISESHGQSEPEGLVVLTDKDGRSLH